MVFWHEKMFSTKPKYIKSFLTEGYEHCVVICIVSMIQPFLKVVIAET